MSAVFSYPTFWRRLSKQAPSIGLVDTDVVRWYRRNIADTHLLLWCSHRKEFSRHHNCPAAWDSPNIRSSFPANVRAQAIFARPSSAFGRVSEASMT